MKLTPYLERLQVVPPGVPCAKCGKTSTEHPWPRTPPECQGEWGDDVCGVVYAFWCPGCDQYHQYRTKAYKGEQRPNGQPVPIWTFNGNAEKPTFRASLLCRSEHAGKKWVCHLFLTDGVIEFCSDSTHLLAGQKVPMQVLP